MNAELANTILGFLTLIAQIVVVVLLITAWRFSKGKLAGFVSRHVLWLVFLNALFAMLASLFYSDVLHYPPCTICWFVRIFMYPLVFIFGLALVKRDRSVLPYGLVLTIPAALIAFYGHLLQFSLVPSIPCSSAAVSCSIRFVLEFGYITLPLMAFTSCAMIILFLVIAKRNSRAE